MPIQDGVGFSNWTPVKLGHLNTIFAMHARITKAVLQKHAYYHQTYHFIDATAGPGIYLVEGQGLKGSPLLFASVAEELGLPYEADLIEINEINLESLQKNLPTAAAGRIRVHCCDYKDVLPELLDKEDENQLGLFYLDPSTGIPDFETVAYVSRMRPKMEILLTVGASSQRILRDV